MGLRRWVILILLVAAPILGFGATADLVSGPYTLSCSNMSQGFQVTVTSVQSGSQSSLQLPLGGCL